MPERGETFHEAFIPEGFIPSRKLCHPLPCETIQTVQKRRKMKVLSREGGGLHFQKSCLVFVVCDTIFLTISKLAFCHICKPPLEKLSSLFGKTYLKLV